MQNRSSSFLPRCTVVFFLLCLNTVLYAQRDVLYYSDAPAGFASRKISKQMLKEDMDFWQKVIEESHVNPWHAISKDEMMRLRENILNALPDSISHFQACFAISRLVGALNEGHLGFASNRVSDSLYAYTCVRFPYFLYDADETGFTVQRDLSAGGKLPLYSRITEINGIPVERLYKKYAGFYGGLEPWKKLMVKNNIRKLLFMDGITSPFHIKAINGKDTIQFITDGYTYKQADSISRVLAAGIVSPGPFSFRFLEDNIAYIEFNSMDGSLRDSFSVFLQRTFLEIQEKLPVGLIIDIRRNGGGDSGLGDSLISYISEKLYRNASGMKMRISSHSKAWAVLNNAKDPFKDWKDGKLYEYKEKKLRKPPANPLRYEGKVAVLIGTGTFSSANMLTNAIKDYQLATLVGERTAEPANDFGEIFSFMLPHTHIVATTAIKMFMRANGDENDFNGILPDIQVKNTPADIQQKKDRVLERAIKWILPVK